MTETELRAIAKTICDDYQKRDAIKGRVKVFDTARDKRLSDLDAEISALESRCDGEDENLIQSLVVKREARARLAAKLQSERGNLVAAVEREAAQSVAGDLPKLFADALVAERAQVIAALLPHSENEARAFGLSVSVDSINALQRWSGSLVHQIPAEVIVQRLATFVSGEKPLWKI